MKKSDPEQDREIIGQMLGNSLMPGFRVRLNADGWAEAIGEAKMGTYHHQLTKNVKMDADRLAKLWEVYKKLQQSVKAIGQQKTVSGWLD
ncbi:hypothetical protein QUA41_31095 [Microcoleus sp. Pol11C1]|uniref:hypothetical protein n=1 Tax=unclassified Microcoleus TaxID=2642155 RepID=UPI002FD01E74